MIYVVDASVAVKWFVRENLSGEAMNLLSDQFELHAPDWIVLEVAHAAFKKSRDGELDPAQARLMISALRGSRLHLHRSIDLVDRAFAISMAVRHAIYDGVYIACAEVTGGIVVTADQALRDAARQTAFSDLVKHLIEV